MRIPRLLRSAAIAIAVAGVIDPAMTWERPVAEPVSVVAIRADAAPAAHAFAESLPGGASASVRVHEEPSRTAACPEAGICVLVSSGDAPSRLTAGAAVAGALMLPAPARAITAVTSPAVVSLHAKGHARVALADAGHELVVTDDGVEIGRAGPDGEQRDVEWVPLSDGVRALRIAAGEDRVDLGVRVVSEPVAVVFHEPETTWLGTFVRRGLQDDARFVLSGRTVVAPSIAVTRGTVPALGAAALEAARVVVVTAPERLSESEVQRLEAFVARRGGSLVVLLDRAPAGPVSRLLPRVGRERHEREPRRIGALRAADFVTFAREPATTVLDGVDDEAVVVSRPAGRGRVIVSGALDAWRHRDATRAFESYWTGLVWSAAQAAGGRLRVEVEPMLARPGEAVRITAEVQTAAGAPDELVAEASYTCGAERVVLRLWPAAGPGTFSGVLRPPSEGTCRIAVAAAGLTETTELLVARDVRRVSDGGARLEAALAAYGAPAVPSEQSDALAARVRALLPAARQPSTVHPMRSPWWMVPFAALLGTEWAVGRRRRLR